MAIGSRGAYATVQPNQSNPIGDALAYTENQSFKYRQEDEAKQEKLKRAEDAKLKEFADWDGKFDATIIGNQSIDDPLVGFAMKAKNRAGDITKEIYATTDFNKKAQLMSERNKLLQSFEIANQQPKMIQKKVAELQEGIKQGKYNPRDVDFMKNISKQIESGKFELNYDDRGVAKIKIFETDESGKPIGVLKETTLGDLANEFNPKLAFNYEAYKDLSLKNVKPDEYGSQVGANVVKGTKISEGNKKQAETYADVIVSDPNKLYEAQFIFKENDPEKLRVKLEEDFLTSIPQGKVQSIDEGYLNYKQRQFEYGDKKKQEAIIVGDPSVVKEKGVKDGVELQVSTKSFPLGNVIIKGTGGKEQKATNVYVNPSGKMFLRVEESGFGNESQSEKVPNEKGLATLKTINPKTKKNYTEAELLPEEFKTVTTSDKSSKVKMLDFGKDANEIGRYAIRMGYDSAKDLQDDFIARSGGDKFFKAKKETKKVYGGVNADGSIIWITE